MITLPKLPNWATTVKLEVNSTGFNRNLSLVAYNYNNKYSEIVTSDEYECSLLEQAGMTSIDLGQSVTFFNRSQLTDYLLRNPNQAVMVNWYNNTDMSPNYGILYAGKWEGVDTILYRYKEGEVQLSNGIYDHMFKSDINQVLINNPY